MIEDVKDVNNTTERPMVLPGPGDSIRIVPLYVPEEFTQLKVGAVPPKLTYRGGPLLSSVQVFTVLWGAAWETSPEKDLIPQLNGFFDHILKSALIDQLAEYSVAGYSIGHGKRVGSATITAPRLRHTVTDHAIRHMLQQEISTNSAFPQPSPNTLYFVYLPPGVSVSQGGARSCQAFCG